MITRKLGQSVIYSNQFALYTLAMQMCDWCTIVDTQVPWYLLILVLSTRELTSVGWPSNNWVIANSETYTSIKSLAMVRGCIPSDGCVIVKWFLNALYKIVNLTCITFLYMCICVVECVEAVNYPRPPERVNIDVLINKRLVHGLVGSSVQLACMFTGK